ncbi:hypothetical protein TNCV_3485301 [Trichonephila clavipes]|nr:hypothetical protein TNCV_3485301 [Trichonephila clavipes]
MKPYHDPAKQIETEDKEIQDIIPPKEPYKGPITRSRIKPLNKMTAGAVFFLEGSNATHIICYKSRQPSWQSVGLHFLWSWVQIPAPADLSKDWNFVFIFNVSFV